MERLQGIATRPHRLRPAQSSKVSRHQVGWGQGPGGLEAASPPVPSPRSPVTTALSSRAVWSRCCCWGHAAWRVLVAAPTREQRGGTGQGGVSPGARRQRRTGGRVCLPDSSRPSWGAPIRSPRHTWGLPLTAPAASLTWWGRLGAKGKG